MELPWFLWQEQEEWPHGGGAGFAHRPPRSKRPHSFKSSEGGNRQQQRLESVSNIRGILALTQARKGVEHRTSGAWASGRAQGPALYMLCVLGGANCKAEAEGLGPSAFGSQILSFSP